MICAKEYGQALFELAQDEKKEKEFLEEVYAIRDILAKEPQYVQLLDAPNIPQAQRLSLLDEAFSSLSPYPLNVLKLLCEKHAIKQYPDCAAAYQECYDKAFEIIRATAITAIPMTDKQCDQLQSKLHTITKKQVILQNVVDPSVLGGVTLRLAGTQMDGSMKSRVDELRRRLSGAIV